MKIRSYWYHNLALGAVIFNWVTKYRYHIVDQNGIHFLTLTTVEHIDVFTKTEHRRVIVDSLNFCIRNKGLTVYAWCLMSSRLYLIAKARKGFNLSAILRDFKKFTSKQILKDIVQKPESRKLWMISRFAFNAKPLSRIKYFKVWIDGGESWILDCCQATKAAIGYIHNKPVVEYVVLEPSHYIFSSAKDYSGSSGLVDIELLDF